MSVLEVRDLRVELDTPRGTAHVVNGLDYTVDAGETVAIVGESGSGKSVSVMALLGLLPGHARVTGSARFEGRELVGSSEAELRTVRGNGIGMVFQDPMTSLNPVLTIGRQVGEGCSRTGSCPRRRPRGNAPPNSSPTSACPTRAGCWTGTRTSCPAGCASASSSRSPWRGTRGCSSPTRRRPRWT